MGILRFTDLASANEVRQNKLRLAERMQSIKTNVVKPSRQERQDVLDQADRDSSRVSTLTTTLEYLRGRLIRNIEIFERRSETLALGPLLINLPSAVFLLQS